jgi:hypothetical protein
MFFGLDDPIVGGCIKHDHENGKIFLIIKHRSKIIEAMEIKSNETKYLINIKKKEIHIYSNLLLNKITLENYGLTPGSTSIDPKKSDRFVKPVRIPIRDNKYFSRETIAKMVNDYLDIQQIISNDYIKANAHNKNKMNTDNIFPIDETDYYIPFLLIKQTRHRFNIDVDEYIYLYRYKISNDYEILKISAVINYEPNNKYSPHAAIPFESIVLFYQNKPIVLEKERNRGNINIINDRINNRIIYIEETYGYENNIITIYELVDGHFKKLFSYQEGL